MHIRCAFGKFIREKVGTVADEPVAVRLCQTCIFTSVAAVATHHTSAAWAPLSGAWVVMRSLAPRSLATLCRYSAADVHPSADCVVATWPFSAGQ